MTDEAHRELEDAVEELVAAMTKAVAIIDGKSLRSLRTLNMVKTVLDAALAKYRDGEPVSL